MRCGVVKVLYDAARQGVGGGYKLKALLKIWVAIKSQALTSFNQKIDYFAERDVEQWGKFGSRRYNSVQVHSRGGEFCPQITGLVNYILPADELPASKKWGR